MLPSIPYPRPQNRVSYQGLRFALTLHCPTDGPPNPTHAMASPWSAIPLPCRPSRTGSALLAVAVAIFFLCFWYEPPGKGSFGQRSCPSYPCGLFKEPIAVCISAESGCGGEGLWHVRSGSTSSTGSSKAFLRFVSQTITNEIFFLTTIFILAFRLFKV